MRPAVMIHCKERFGPFQIGTFFPPRVNDKKRKEEMGKDADEKDIFIVENDCIYRSYETYPLELSLGQCPGTGS